MKIKTIKRLANVGVLLGLGLYLSSRLLDNSPVLDQDSQSYFLSSEAAFASTLRYLGVLIAFPHAFVFGIRLFKTKGEKKEGVLLIVSGSCFMALAVGLPLVVQHYLTNVDTIFGLKPGTLERLKKKLDTGQIPPDKYDQVYDMYASATYHETGQKVERVMPDGTISVFEPDEEEKKARDTILAAKDFGRKLRYSALSILAYIVSCAGIGVLLPPFGRSNAAIIDGTAT